MTIKRLQLLACCHRPLFEKLHDRMLDHYIHLSALLHCSALRLISIFLRDCLLWLLLTSHSSLLLRLMKPPVRPHGISPCSFIIYPPDLRIWVTATFWASLPLANLPAIYALLSGFCS